jgi:hypothetical protein
MKSSAKAPKESPKRIHLTCPVCGTNFSLQPAEYRNRIKKDNEHDPTICCSRKCGWVLWRVRKDLALKNIKIKFIYNKDRVGFDKND